MEKNEDRSKLRNNFEFYADYKNRLAHRVKKYSGVDKGIKIIVLLLFEGFKNEISIS